MSIKKDYFKDEENLKYVNRKSVLLLKNYTTRFWDMKPRKYTKISVLIQKKIRKAVSRARELWVLPYIK